MRSLIAVAALALAGCMASESDSGDVVATDHAFAPLHLDVEAGTTVGWINEGDAPHTVSIPVNGTYIYDEEFESGERVEYTFEEPGMYDVVCIYHPGMDMTVNVTA